MPFSKILSVHIKKNNPFAMLVVAIKYCTTYKIHLREREKLRVLLVVNKCPGKFIYD